MPSLSVPFCPQTKQTQEAARGRSGEKSKSINPRSLKRLLRKVMSKATSAQKATLEHSAKNDRLGFQLLSPQDGSDIYDQGKEKYDY
jgi:hypothetical protein